MKEKKLQILYIDDDPAEVFILEETLVQAPGFAYELVHSENLTHAFEVLKSSFFDVILLDLGLPESTGIDTLEQFLRVHNQTAVVVITGLNDFDVSVSAIEKGAQDYLVKGQYEPLLLIKTIKFAIERKKMQEMTTRHIKLESLGTLSGGIAHEFNNILTVITGNIELAADMIPESNRVKAYIEEAGAAALRARDVVRKLLNVAQKMRASRTPLPIGPTIKDILDLIQKDLPVSIEMCQDIRCSSERISGDPVAINQVVMNLCTNAVHAMSDQTGVLTVSLEAIELNQPSSSRLDGPDSGPYARLVVTDTGKGIEAAIMPRLFDPYFTTKEVNEGLGMGLAVVHGIVKEHGGFIKIESTPGKGTMVEVLLPLLKEPPERNRNTKPSC
jgi:signal transduction histidine kinase